MHLSLPKVMKLPALMLVSLPLPILLVAWLGVYNVAASLGHPHWLEWFLELGMTRSIAVRSSDMAAPADLQDRARIRLGAAHFQGGCAECHGAPGQAVNPVYAHMLPGPPVLALAVRNWSPGELHRIVRHGLQFTGMPAWSAAGRDDEVWTLVAFLLALPELNEAGYRELAAGNSTIPDPRQAEALVTGGTLQLARTACDRCHDTADAAPPSALVPRLAGQAADYLERSLHEYKHGVRRSGFMQPVAAALSERQIEELARHYSALPPAMGAANPAMTGMNASSMAASPADAAQAVRLATGSEAGLRVPACLSCHDGQARTDYPALAGQQAAYLATQLRLFRAGGRRHSAWGEVMTVIARRLDDEQIDALAQWFSAQDPRPTRAAP